MLIPLPTTLDLLRLHFWSGRLHPIVMHKPVKARMPKHPDLRTKARMPKQPDLKAYAFKLKSQLLHCHLKVALCHLPDLHLTRRPAKPGRCTCTRLINRGARMNGISFAEVACQSWCQRSQYMQLTRCSLQAASTCTDAVISNLRDANFDGGSKANTVTWRLPVSKTDAAAKGCERTWGCLCSPRAIACPYHAAVAQDKLLMDKFPEHREDRDIPLFPR